MAEPADFIEWVVRFEKMDTEVENELIDRMRK